MSDHITRREWDDTEDDERLEYVQLLEARVDARDAEIARLRADLRHAQMQEDLHRDAVFAAEVEATTSPSAKLIDAKDAEIARLRAMNEQDLSRLAEAVELGSKQAEQYDAEIARLRAALEPFTRIFTDAASGPCEESDVILTRHASILSMLGVEPVTLTVGHVRAAIVALKGDA
jgi:hypothetical protein